MSFVFLLSPASLCWKISVFHPPGLRPYGGYSGECPRRRSRSRFSRRTYVSSFRGRCSCAGFLSSCLLSARYFSDEENIGFYREDEAHLAARFPSTCALERTLDGRGGDPRPEREGALADLDGNAYHLSVLLSLADTHAASHSGTKSGIGSPET